MYLIKLKKKVDDICLNWLALLYKPYHNNLCILIINASENTLGVQFDGHFMLYKIIKPFLFAALSSWWSTIEPYCYIWMIQNVLARMNIKSINSCTLVNDYILYIFTVAAYLITNFISWYEPICWPCFKNHFNLLMLIVKPANFKLTGIADFLPCKRINSSKLNSNNLVNHLTSSSHLPLLTLCIAIKLLYGGQ